jgi:hypothetical protein
LKGAGWNSQREASAATFAHGLIDYLAAAPKGRIEKSLIERGIQMLCVKRAEGGPLVG